LESSRYDSIHIIRFFSIISLQIIRELREKNECLLTISIKYEYDDDDYDDSSSNDGGGDDDNDYIDEDSDDSDINVYG